MTAAADNGRFAPVLETRGLSIRFGGHTAVDDVSCAFRAGELTAVVGPNGAGKTTYFNLISGQLRPDAGRVLLSGEDVTAAAPARRAMMGVGRAFQLTNLFPNLTALENVRLAVQARRRMGFRAFARADRLRGMIDEARRRLADAGLVGREKSLARELPHGDQRKLEVAILTAMEPRVFMFDEPTAGMSADEAPVLLRLIESLKARGDRALLLVEHKMEVVRSLADRVVVLRDGRKVADGPPAEVAASPAAREAYLGLDALE